MAVASSLLLVGLAAACGSTQQNELPAGRSVASDLDVPDSSATDEPDAAAPDSMAAAGTMAAPESVAAPVIVAATTATPDTMLGPLTFSLPPGAGDFRQSDAVPDFVVATQRWSIGDKGIVGVTIQDVVPLLPAEDLITEFDANGLHWQAYETGKSVGSGTTAYAVIEETSAVLVGGQAWTGADADAMLRGYVIDIARSLAFEKAQPGRRALTSSAAYSPPVVSSESSDAASRASDSS